MTETKTRQMKPSGVPWLGDIPEGWAVIRIKDAATLATVRASNNDNYIGLENVESGTGRFLPASDETFSAESSAVAIQKGDILFGKLRPYLAKCHLAEWDGCCSSEFLVLRTRKQEPRFLEYSLLSPTFIDHVNMSTYGTKMPRANWGIVGGAVAAFPPIPEQRAIADFLDEKCAAIDAIVEEAKSGIEEYAKWKQSVVFQAVTKGIPEGERHPTSDHRLPGDSRLSTSDGPDVESRMSDVEKGSRKSDVGRRKSRPMKDSGVEWIGEIPEEWKVLPLKRHVDMLTPMRDKPEDLSGPIPWIRIEDFEGKFISKSKDGLGVSDETISQMNLKVYPVGTVLCTSSCDLGKCAIVSTPLVSNQRFIGIIPKPSISSDFLYYLMLSNAERLNMLSTGTIQANLSRVEFERLRVQIPPLPEQRAIADYLDEKCSAIDALIEEKKQLIEDLGVYKKSLIYETVTGKRLPTTDGRLPGDDRLPTADNPEVGGRKSEVESRKSEVGCRKSKAPEIGNNVTERTLS